MKWNESSLEYLKRFGCIYYPEVQKSRERNLKNQVREMNIYWL